MVRSVTESAKSKFNDDQYQVLTWFEFINEVYFCIRSRLTTKSSCSRYHQPMNLVENWLFLISHVLSSGLKFSHNGNGHSHCTNVGLNLIQMRLIGSSEVSLRKYGGTVLVIGLCSCGHCPCFVLLTDFLQYERLDWIQGQIVEQVLELIKRRLFVVSVCYFWPPPRLEWHYRILPTVYNRISKVNNIIRRTVIFTDCLSCAFCYHICFKRKSRTKERRLRKQLWMRC